MVSRPMARTRPRFVVVETHGWAIMRSGGAATTTGTKRAAPIVVTVLDRAVCHRIVAEFPPPNGRGGGTLPYAKRRALADHLADEMNAEHGPVKAAG